jgi:hypothetical protein
MRRIAVSLLAAAFLAALPWSAVAQEALRLRLQTDFGPLFLHVDIEQRSVEGFYPKNRGHVYGRLSESGMRMHGTWVEANGSDHPCRSASYGSYSWGHFVFTYDERPEPGTQMTGYWGYCDEQPNRPWNGTFD